MRFKESETVELKKSTSELKEALESISSILNKHQKGEVYFGIKNDGSVVGQDITESTIREVSKAIADHIEPKIYPKIRKLMIEDKPCVLVEFHGADIPYFANGRSYMRVGDEDRQLSAKEIENIVLKKNKGRISWDKEVCQKAAFKDISSAKLKSFLKITGLKFDSIKNSLEKLKLAADGKLLNSAVILFGKNPEVFFPNAKLRCAVFGTATTSNTIDMQDFEGDIFHLIEEAQKYILKNIHIGMRIEGLRRIDVPEIDKEALREAIINAFCHRDYYEYDSVNIAIFKGRVEIRNPGKLYGGLTIEKIMNENISKRRNELIAEMFNKIHYMERWGRGIELILSKEPETKFKEVAGIFTAVFKRKGEPKAVEKTVEKTVEKILALIKENPKLTQKELVEKTGLTRRGIEWNIQNLKKRGTLRRVGGDKGGYWEVIEK